MNDRSAAVRATIGALIVVLIVIIGLTWGLLMHTVTVEPGRHAVIVDKPYFFGHEGVRREPLREGRLLLWKTSTSYVVPVTNQSVTIAFDDFSSKDNYLLDFQTTIQLRILDAVDMVENFGEQWFDNNVRMQYASIVREAVKTRDMPEMMSNVAAAKAMDDTVTKDLQALVKEAKLPVLILGVSLGRAKPNETVLSQMNETAAQEQRQKTLVKAEAAELQRKKEQTAKAAADNAYRNEMGLNPEQFVQLEQIKRYAEACAAAQHCVVASGQTPVILPASAKSK